LSQVPDFANKKIVLAHLGSGASLCAVKNGQVIDTTMNFSPTSGIPMSTRSGDLDPTISTFLAKNEGLSFDEIEKIFNHSSGLLGISGLSGDMKTLLENQNTNPDCAEAVKKFVYEIKKTIGAYSAIMGGLDCLVFSGGIGERSSELRSRICDNLEFLNIKIDQQKNELAEQIISADGTIEVMVMPTNEEYIIGKQTLQKI
jgi:acetate kinase